MTLRGGVWPVEVDAGEMELAILNLCVNARDAMADGGAIIDRRRERARAGDVTAARGDFVKISVADTGHGMPPEVQARAFEPFFTTKDIEQGIGPRPAAGLWLRAAVWRARRDCAARSASARS